MSLDLAKCKDVQRMEVMLCTCDSLSQANLLGNVYNWI